MSRTAPEAAGTRIPWEAVPAHVRGAVEAALGSPVVSAATQHGGFSPGAAARVVCADGRRAFVKACGPEINPDTPDLNRAEVTALGVMPASVPHARLLSAYDDGQWVCLVLEDVDGRRPRVPWTPADVTATSSTLERVAATRAPHELPPFADAMPALTVLESSDDAALPAEVRRRVPGLARHLATAREVTRGDRLVHWDARADNILVRAGQAVLLDWAWACRGAPWLDTLMLAADFRMQGGPDADQFLATSPVTRDIPGEQLASVIAVLACFWLERAGQPAPRGLPTIRAWQQHCGSACLEWLETGSRWA